MRMFAFIRAINTGNRRLTNQQVIKPFRTFGLEDVEAYQAAGNVTFRSAGDPLELEGDLEAVLSAAYGFDAPTFVRTSVELRDATADLPFAADTVAPTQGRIQITFLRDAATDAQLAEVGELVPDDDIVAFAGRHWFWLPRTGVSDSALPVPRIERIVGPMTMRTLGTVERMLARFGE